MSNRKILWLSLFLFLSIVSFVFADTIYLKNGRSINGVVNKREGDEVELAVSSGSVTFRKAEIRDIQIADQEVNSRLRSNWQAQKIQIQNRIVSQKLLEESKPRSVEFSGDNQNIYVKAILNKKVEVKFVLDTGASMIMLRKGVAEKLGMRVENIVGDMKVQVVDGRMIDAKQVVLKSVSVEGVEVHDVPAAILLDEVGSMGSVGGLLGMTFLKKFNFKVDYSQKKLILEKI